MPNFYRKVDLIALVGTYLNSPSLASILSRIGVRHFLYLVDITLYAPATEGWNLSPDRRFPDEPDELEFRTEYDLSYVAKEQLMEFLRSAARRYVKESEISYRNLFFYLWVRLNLWLYDENIYEGFIQHEQSWLDSEDAYKQALETAKDSAFDPD